MYAHTKIFVAMPVEHLGGQGSKREHVGWVVVGYIGKLLPWLVVGRRGCHWVMLVKLWLDVQKSNMVWAGIPLAIWLVVLQQLSVCKDCAGLACVTLSSDPRFVSVLLCEALLEVKALENSMTPALPGVKINMQCTEEQAKLNDSIMTNADVAIKRANATKCESKLVQTLARKASTSTRTRLLKYTADLSDQIKGEWQSMVAPQLVPLVEAQTKSE